MNSTVDNTTCMFRNSEPNVVAFIGDSMITDELTEFNAGTVLVMYFACFRITERVEFGRSVFLDHF